MLTLYHTLRSPFARKVRILLDEMGLEHHAEELPVGIDGRIFPASYEDQVPSLRVPSIRDGDRIVFESNVVEDYLLRNYPTQPKAPLDPPLAGAMVREDQPWEDQMVLSAIEAILNAGFNLAMMQRWNVDGEAFPYRNREETRIQSCLDWLERNATPEGFAPGVFSMADLNLMCALQWFEERGLAKWRGRPNLEAIVARYEARPTVAGNPLFVPPA